MGATTEPVDDPASAVERRGTRELFRQSFLGGVVAETGRTRGRPGESFDAVMASAPGVAELGWRT